MKASKNQTLASLRHAEVCRIEDLGSNYVLPIKSQISPNLFPNTHLIHTRDIFHDERFGQGLADYLHELSIEGVARVVYQPGVILHLGISLTGGTSHQDISRSRDVDNFLSYTRFPEVT